MGVGEEREDSTEEELVGQVTRHQETRGHRYRGPLHLLQQHKHPPQCPAGESTGHTINTLLLCLIQGDIRFFSLKCHYLTRKTGIFSSTLASNYDAEQSTVSVSKINPN